MNNTNIEQTSFLNNLKKITPHLILLPSIALLLSGVMTLANIGLSPEFISTWIRAFGISLIVLPLALICVGIIDKKIESYFASLHWVGRKLIVAFLTACVLETVLSLATTLVNNPLNSQLFHFWWIAFSRSLPVGIIIGLFMCFYMKPKLDRLKNGN